MNKGVLKNVMNDTRTKYTFHGAHFYATGKEKDDTDSTSIRYKNKFSTIHHVRRKYQICLNVCTG
jgi:hypothetical protein